LIIKNTDSCSAFRTSIYELCLKENRKNRGTCKEREIYGKNKLCFYGKPVMQPHTTFWVIKGEYIIQEDVMRKLVVFNQISLDGYFVDSNGDMSWAHNPNKDEEWSKFVSTNASTGGLLIFGRITYELMAGYWPTPAAIRNDPVVAEGMNNLPKVVFSGTLGKATWNNTKLIKEGMVSAIRTMKNESGIDMVIMGSGSIVLQLTQERLIDEYQIVVIPIILGKGRTLFDGIDEMLSLKLLNSRTFDNGNVFLCYKPLE
jgi:dihydrofolate reductase